MKTLETQLKPLIPIWRKLLIELKGQIADDYRASDDPFDTTPGMCVTIGFTPAEHEEFEVTANDVAQGDNVHPDTQKRLPVGNYKFEAKAASWSYQTGDNSYTGGAYSHPHWAVISLYRKSNSTELANEIAEQLGELVCQ